MVGSFHELLAGVVNYFRNNKCIFCSFFFSFFFHFHNVCADKMWCFTETCCHCSNVLVSLTPNLESRDNMELSFVCGSFFGFSKIKLQKANNIFIFLFFMYGKIWKTKVIKNPVFNYFIFLLQFSKSNITYMIVFQDAPIRFYRFWSDGLTVNECFLFWVLLPATRCV